MMVLAAWPGMVSELLVTGKLVKPGNFRATTNLLGSQLRKVGLEYHGLVASRADESPIALGLWNWATKSTCFSTPFRTSTPGSAAEGLAMDVANVREVIGLETPVTAQ